MAFVSSGVATTRSDVTAVPGKEVKLRSSAPGMFWSTTVETVAATSVLAGGNAFPMPGLHAVGLWRSGCAGVYDRARSSVLRRLVWNSHPQMDRKNSTSSALLIPRRAVKIIQRRWSKGGRYFLQDVNDTILKRPRYDLPPNG